MACPGCSSPNTEKLSHYWESLPGESPLKVRYAPPAVVQARVLMVLGVVAAAYGSRSRAQSCGAWGWRWLAWCGAW
ncbi:hypothetical protein ACFQ51_52180 [Streptomyces kaempferi]